jgi:hypothetical protein
VTIVRIPLESRLLLAAASAFVPRRLRTEWRKEWEGEIWWWITMQPDVGQSVRERLALAFHCAGAMVDGLCLGVEDEDRIAALHAALRKPGVCLAAGMLLLALVGVLSGGFANTRRSLRYAFFPQDVSVAVLSQTGPFSFDCGIRVLGLHHVNGFWVERL